MTALSSTALKALFQTGDVPSETDFSNLIDSFGNIVDSNSFVGSSVALVDVTPADSSTALPLVSKFNQLTTTHAIIGASILPAALVGRELYILSLGAYASRLYSQSGDTFVSFVGGDNIQIEPGDCIHIVCFVNGKWSVFISKGLDAAPSYERYYAAITQAGTAAPIVNFSHTDMGNPIWSRVGVGSYQLTLADAFNGNTVVFVTSNNPGYVLYAQKMSEAVIQLDVTDLLGIASDDILDHTSIYIKNFIIP